MLETVTVEIQLAAWLLAPASILMLGSTQAGAGVTVANNTHKKNEVGPAHTT
jgi:hypothetical protein